MKKWLLEFLCAFCVMMFFTTGAIAAEVVESGYFGKEENNLTWTLYDNGVLAIGGSGEMNSFWGSNEPWKDFKEQIKAIAFQDGVTSISDFYPGSNLTSVYIPNSVVSIDSGFCYRYKDKSIYYSGSSEELSEIQGMGYGWDEWSFYYGKTFVRYDVDFISWPMPFQTVTFDSNGGSVELESKPILVNTAYGFLPVPEREGYFFNGWYLSRNDGKRVSPSSIVRSNSDHVLYAHWKQSDSLIASGSFGDMLWELDNKGVLSILGSGAIWDYGNGEKKPWADYQNTSVIYLQEGITKIGAMAFNYRTKAKIIYMPDTITEVSSYIFGSDSFGTNYSGKHFLYSGSQEQWLTIFGEPKESPRWSRVTLYYDSPPPAAYLISFDANNGTLSDETAEERTVVNGVIYDSMPFAHRSGYIFDGWYDSPVGGNRASKSTVVNLSSDQTLYAHWKQDSSVIVAYYFKDQVWTLNRNGVLTISGEGYTPPYDAYQEYFTDNHDIELEKQTKTLIVEDGITSIETSAFESYENLNKLVLAGSVKSVWTGAFMGCPITDLTLSEGIEWLGSWSFCECTQLTNVKIPASLTSLGESAFGGCTGIEQFDVAPENSVFQSIDGALFIRGEDGLSLYYYPAGNPRTTYTVPNGVTSISSSGGYGTFSGTSHLTNVILSRGITYISRYAFRSCENLKSVFIPESVSEMDDGVFLDCGNLTDIYYEGTEAQWNEIEISDYRNEDMDSMTIHYGANVRNFTVSIPTTPTVNGVPLTSANLRSLTDITVPVSVSADVPTEVNFILPFYDENGRFLGVGCRTETVNRSTTSVSVSIVGDVSNANLMKVLASDGHHVPLFVGAEFLIE